MGKRTIVKEFDNSGTRSDVRRRVVEFFMLEAPGTGRGDLVSKYDYVVKVLSDGEKVILTRPANLKNGFGFPPSDISDISINDNNIEDYETTCSAGVFLGSPLGCVDVFFDATTHDLTFCGNAGIVIDRGVNNAFTEDNCPECQ